MLVYLSIFLNSKPWPSSPGYGRPGAKTAAEILGDLPETLYEVIYIYMQIHRLYIGGSWDYRGGYMGVMQDCISIKENQMEHEMENASEATM